MQHMIDSVISGVLWICGLILAVVNAVDSFLTIPLTAVGLTMNAQLIIIIIISVALTALSIRLFHGVLTAVLVILLVLMIAHRVLPGMQVNVTLPGGLQNAAGPQN